MRFGILLLALVSATAGRASVVSELKAALGQLSGREPVKARVTLAISNRSGGDDEKPETDEGKATAAVEEGPDGMSIFWSRETIDAALAEGRGRGTRGAMGGMSAMALHEYLNMADKLLGSLGDTELIEETADTWEGKPVRRATFKVTPKLNAQSRKYVKELEATAKLWLGADGVPLALESHTRMKGRALMVIGFESNETESYRFARVRDRLVATRHEKESQQSGAGQGGTRKSVATLEVLGE